MIKFSPLSQRLLLAYITAAAVFIGLILTLNKAEQLPMLYKVALSIAFIGVGFFIQHLLISKHLLQPIHRLIAFTKNLAPYDNLNQKAPEAQNDEMGELVDAFNKMIHQIQLREDAIISERDKAMVAQEQANNLARVTRDTNQKLATENEERILAEMNLMELQQQLNSIINSMPSALIAIDENLTVTQWNDKATDLSETKRRRAIGKRVTQVFPMLAKQTVWIKQVWIQGNIGTLHNIEQVIDDRVRQFDITLYPLVDAKEKSAVIRVDDVTEKYHMEEAIVQSEKIMSLGGMAAGMAHEINNPVSAIVQNAQNIERRFDPTLPVNQKVASECGIDLTQLDAYLEKRKIKTFLGNISQSGHRASSIVTNMLQFSRSNEITLRPCVISEILSNSINIALTEDTLITGMEQGDFELNIDQNFLAPQTIVQGIFSELEQVLLNLIKNAAYAINERKNTLNDIDEGIIDIQQYVENDQCIIRVSDNGLGMNSGTEKRVFEPFFTTKEVGTGTGLGLSVSYFIITSHHHGRLHVESHLGAGSTFVISLPIAST